MNLYKMSVEELANLSIEDIQNLKYDDFKNLNWVKMEILWNRTAKLAGERYNEYIKRSNLDHLIKTKAINQFEPENLIKEIPTKYKNTQELHNKIRSQLYRKIKMNIFFLRDKGSTIEGMLEISKNLAERLNARIGKNVVSPEDFQSGNFSSDFWDTYNTTDWQIEGYDSNQAQRDLYSYMKNYRGLNKDITSTSFRRNVTNFFKRKKNRIRNETTRKQKSLDPMNAIHDK